MGAAHHQQAQTALADTAADGQRQLVVQQHLVEGEGSARIAAGNTQLTIQGFDSTRKATLTYEKRGRVDSFPLYIGEYGPEFLFPEKAAGKRINTLDTNYRCVSQGAWDMENTLVGTVYSVDNYLGAIKIQFTFVDDTMTIFATKWAENFFDDWRGYLAGHMEK